MIRLLLSLLALITGAAVPGMAHACEFPAPGSAVGARAEAGPQPSAEVARPALRPALAAWPIPARTAPVAAETTAPRVATVLIGIDRARR